MTPSKVGEDTLASAVRELCARDPDLERSFLAWGLPPLWAREAGFQTLVRIILEQQVSLASARAAFDRLCEALGTPTAAGFLTLSDEQLKAIGFSRQKTRYCRLLADSVSAGDLDLAALDELEDGEARDRLMEQTGIGPWTADIYLLMVLRRPDVLPVGDIALAKAAQRVKQLEETPTPEELEEIGDAWKPWRSCAARMLWHHYLSEAGSKT